MDSSDNSEILSILKEYEIPFSLSLIQYWAFFAKDKYNIFKIPKRSGGFREIYAPHKKLKEIADVFTGARLGRFSKKTSCNKY